jgi:hypothetical protein
MHSDFEVFVVVFLALIALSSGLIAWGVFAVRDAIATPRNPQARP